MHDTDDNSDDYEVPAMGGGTTHISPDQIPAGAIPLIMGRSVNPTELEINYLASKGIDMTDPYDDSVQDICGTCGCDVWVGPGQQAAKAKFPEAAIICPSCVQKTIKPWDKVGVASFGTVHPRGN